jgi:hypothetical protein
MAFVMPTFISAIKVGAWAWIENTLRGIGAFG